MLDSPRMPAAGSLLLQACSGCCSMGTGFAQHSSTLSLWNNLDTAVPGCPGTLRMLYVQCCTSPRKATASAAAACAHLFVTATDFDHSPQGCSSRADQPACGLQDRFGHAAHT
jgi:hypothetical protein